MQDIHTHLYMSEYDGDRDRVIARAFASGLTMLISVGTEPLDHEKALSIAREDDRIFTSLGVHPHYFNDNGIDSLEKNITSIRDLVSRNKSKVVAIGECGLDYFSHDGAFLSEEQKRFQKRGFEEQIRLAQELSLPMILHCRASVATQDAYEDIFEILRRYVDMKFVLHCYMGDTRTTNLFLSLSNVFFSFTGNVTYPPKKVVEKTKDDLRETVKMIPFDRLFVETDAPFLAPVPYRGKRNEPAFVIETSKMVAMIKEVSFEDIVSCTNKNARRVFFA